MLVRAALVALTAAVLVPLSGGAAQASCLDDFNASLDDGYSESPKSEYWNRNGRHEHIEYSGTANVTVHGDALVADWGSWFLVDWTGLILTSVGNTPEGTTTFVDCVAG